MSAPGGFDAGASLLPDNPSAQIATLRGGGEGAEDLQKETANAVSMLAITDEEEKKKFAQEYPQCRKDSNLLLTDGCSTVRKYLAMKMFNVLVERTATAPEKIDAARAKDYRGDCKEGILTFQYHIEKKLMFTDYQKDDEFYRIYGPDPVSIYLKFQESNPGGLKSGMNVVDTSGAQQPVVAAEPPKNTAVIVPAIENSNTWNAARDKAVETAAKENSKEAKEPEEKADLPKEPPIPTVSELVPNVENKTLERNAATFLETGKLSNVKKLYKSTGQTVGEKRADAVREKKEQAAATQETTKGGNKRTRRKIRN